MASTVILQMAVGHDLNVVIPGLSPPNQLVNSNQMNKLQSRINCGHPPMTFCHHHCHLSP